MCIPVDDEIGLEVHPDDDQVLFVESGCGVVLMGNEEDCLYFQQPVFNNSAIFVPAGTWHNVINTGDQPLKLFSIYAPPHHPWGTVYQTKADAEAAENHY
jgi:mannose-6-phosphate isomerase-like protein (cupin superfamily)